MLAVNAGAGSIEWAHPTTPFYFGWLAGLLGLRWDYWEDNPSMWVSNQNVKLPRGKGYPQGQVIVEDPHGAVRAYCSLLSARLTVTACDAELEQG